MRYIVLAVVLFFSVGCEYETNYYYGDSDGGVAEAATDSEGEDMASIWTPGSKIFGNASLTLQAAPAAIPLAGPIVLWPFIRDTPAMQGSQTILDLSTIDNQPHVATLTFVVSVARPAPAITAQSDEVVALINMGVGGLQTQVEVDVVQGTTLSLPVNRVQVHLVYRNVPNSVAVPVPAPTYNVGAAVSTGTVAHGRQPQRTLTKATNGGVPALAPGLGEYWFVPAFAKSFKVVANPNTASLLVSLVPVFIGSVPLAQYPMVAYPTADLIIPSGSYFVVVQNTGLANVTSYSLVFDLSL
jgi:hypothetical protein